MAITWNKTTDVFSGTDGVDERLLQRVQEYVYYQRPDGTGDVAPATQAQINTKIKSIETEFAAEVYSLNRKVKYPRITDQFDLLWHAIDSGALDKTSDFYTELKKVKDDNPKPVE